jgi:hypothetical protein
MRLPAALEAAMGEREGTLHVAIDTYGTDVQLRMVASGRASSPLALGVRTYFYLSLPLLLVQIFIDFGYTIGLISERHQCATAQAAAPSGGVSFGNLSFTAGDLPPTGVRIVTPTRGRQ